jgi:FtsP/CotA-like multicopper oxidase with cupredoxin domain
VAYPGVSYGLEGILIFSEIDPVFHDAVVTGDFGPGLAVSSTIDYSPQYFLFNGQAEIILTGVVPAIAVGDRLLVRLLNAGMMTRSPLLLGSLMTLVSEDGNLRPFPSEKHSALTLTAGKTMDVLVVPSSGGVSMSLFDRRGFVSRGAAAGSGTPTQQPIEGLPTALPGATSIPALPVSATAGTGGGGGGGGGFCFISSLTF